LFRTKEGEVRYEYRSLGSRSASTRADRANREPW
jgi:hypothetical protein